MPGRPAGPPPAQRPCAAAETLPSAHQGFWTASSPDPGLPAPRPRLRQQQVQGPRSGGSWKAAHVPSSPAGELLGVSPRAQQRPRPRTQYSCNVKYTYMIIRGTKCTGGAARARALAIRSLPRTTRTTAPALFQDEIAAYGLQYGQYGRLAARNGGAGETFTVFLHLARPLCGPCPWATPWANPVGNPADGLSSLARCALARASSHDHIHREARAFFHLRVSQ